MEEWAKWLAEFEEALIEEQSQEIPNDDMIKLLKKEIDECKEMLND
jgi:hypothetical protein